MKRRHAVALLIILVPIVVYCIYYFWAGKALSAGELTTIGVILLIVSTWVGFAKDLIDLWRKLTGREIPPPRPPDFPFTVVREPDKVLTMLLGESPGPLADDKTLYQERLEGRDITSELREALETHRQVLVSGISGLGKTREIGRLARRLVEEEYTLLVHDKHDRLLTRVRFPEELRNTRNLLFVFDDLHTPCASVEEGAGGAEGLAGRETFHDRLQRLLDQAVKQFGRREVNVLAAARREGEHWSHLRWESHPLWRGFRRYDLPSPEEEAQARFLRDVAERGEVELPEGDVERIAQANDRTFRNLLENVIRARAAGESLTAETFLPNQMRTFEQTYAELREAHPRLVPRLWDALHLLRSSGLPTQPGLTADLAARLDTAWLLRWRPRRRLLSLMEDLVSDGHLAHAAETGELTVQEDLLAAKADLPDAVQHFDTLWTAVQGLGPAALPLWYRLAEYAYYRGHAAVAERVCRAILHKEPEHIAALNLLALAAQGQGRSQESIAYLERLRTLAQQQGDKQAEGVVLGNLGSAYGALGQVERAIEYYEQGLVIAREIGGRRMEGAVLGNLGLAYRALGQVERAIEHHQQALEIAREIGARRVEGAAMGNLGLAYYLLGQVERAIEHYEQALEIAREIGDWSGEGLHLGNLGSAYGALGQVERAIEHHEQALEIAREIGDRRSEGNGLGNLGNAYGDLGQVERAIEYHQQALVISREIGDRRGEGNWLGNLGVAYCRLGQVERAIEHSQQALEIAREIGDRRGEGNALGNLGLAYGALGQVERAIEHYEQALEISREIGDRRGEGNRLGNLGNAYADLGQPEKARDLWLEALRIFEEIKSPHAEMVRGRLEELGDG